MKYYYVILNGLFILFLNNVVECRTFLQTIENRSLVSPLVANVGKECTNPGILCDCDDIKKVYVCISKGDDFIKELVDECKGDTMCNEFVGGCSEEPNSCTVFPFTMQCTSDGMFPDPYNCKKYYICVPEKKDANDIEFDAKTSTTPEPADTTTSSSGEVVDSEYKAYEMECDDGYGYDPTTTFCQMELKNDECQSSLIQPCTKWTFPKSFTSNPSYYYLCEKDGKNDDYQPKIFRCPHGEPFINGTCVSKNSGEINCDQNDKRVPDPTDCTAYFECQNGEPDRKQCKKGWSFNAKTLKCEKGLKNCK